MLRKRGRGRMKCKMDEKISPENLKGRNMV